MELSNVTIMTVNYNSTELTKRLLDSIVCFYPEDELKIVVVDGSDNETYIEQMKELCNSTKYNSRITLHSLGYNIHHGTGMIYGLNNIKTKYTLILDNDVYLTKSGSIELIFEKIKNEINSFKREIMFVGCQMFVNESGKTVIVESKQDKSIIQQLVPTALIEQQSKIDQTKVDIDHLIKYIHPSFMFVNREMYMKYISDGILRPFIKHGAPCITTMVDIKEHDLENILCDMSEQLIKYFVHDWNGVVKQSGGYHLSMQHHFGSAKEGYIDIPTNLDEYLKQQSEFDKIVDEEDKQIQARAKIAQNPKKFGVGHGKRKLNKKELKKLAQS